MHFHLKSVSSATLRKLEIRVLSSATLRKLMRSAPLWERQAEAENAKLCAAPNTKPSNPKDALGILKVPFSTVSAPVLAEVGVGMLEGAMKYGRHNYRVIGVRASVYYDATMRHMTAWWEGEDLDPDSSDDPALRLHHTIKAIASLCVIRDAMIQGKFVDDRPPPSPAGWQNDLNVKVKALVAKYPSPVAPYVKDDPRGA